MITPGVYKTLHCFPLVFHFDVGFCGLNGPSGCPSGARLGCLASCCATGRFIGAVLFKMAFDPTCETGAGAGLGCIWGASTFPSLSPRVIFKPLSSLLRLGFPRLQFS